MSAFGSAVYGTAVFGPTVAGPAPVVARLRTLWINDAADPGDVMAFAFMASLSVGTAARGEVRTYAGGRRRAIVRAGLARSPRASLPWCTRAQVAWLEAHVKRLVWVRDHTGRRIAGMYFGVEVSEHRFNDEADVELAIEEVSASDAVAAAGGAMVGVG